MKKIGKNSNKNVINMIIQREEMGLNNVREKKASGNVENEENTATTTTPTTVELNCEQTSDAVGTDATNNDNNNDDNNNDNKDNNNNNNNNSINDNNNTDNKTEKNEARLAKIEAQAAKASKKTAAAQSTQPRPFTVPSDAALSAMKTGLFDWCGCDTVYCVLLLLF